MHANVSQQGFLMHYNIPVSIQRDQIKSYIRIYYTTHRLRDFDLVSVLRLFPGSTDGLYEISLCDLLAAGEVTCSDLGIDFYARVRWKEVIWKNVPILLSAIRAYRGHGHVPGMSYRFNIDMPDWTMALYFLYRNRFR